MYHQRFKCNLMLNFTILTQIQKTLTEDCFMYIETLMCNLLLTYLIERHSFLSFYINIHSMTSMQIKNIFQRTIAFFQYAPISQDNDRWIHRSLFIRHNDHKRFLII